MNISDDQIQVKALLTSNTSFQKIYIDKTTLYVHTYTPHMYGMYLPVSTIFLFFLLEAFICLK
jgi:hypothetical protein